MTQQFSGKRLGALVARYRKAQNLSAREVSRKSGVDIATLTRLEKGEYAQPTMATLKGLHRTLDIPMIELVTALDMFTPFEVVHMANAALTKGYLLPGEAQNLHADYVTHLIEAHGLGDLGEASASN